MNIGVKISSEGYDIQGKESKKNVDSPPSSNVTSHMISGIAVAFLYGADVSLKRYVEAASKAESDANYVYECLHEVSSLMEHLDSVDRYMIMCGVTDHLHSTILDIRNHIRHDLRDNLSHESNKGRTQRAKKLGINQKLLVHIGFSADAIKVGTTILKVSDIAAFIKTAEQTFMPIIQDGIEAGRIQGASIADK
jgi:hypothetical protein